MGVLVVGGASWTAEAIAMAGDLDTTPALAEGLRSSSAHNGNTSVVGVSEDGDILRFYWRTDFGSDWSVQNVTQDVIEQLG